MKPTKVIVEVPTPTYPPDELLQDCQEALRAIETNEDLAQAYLDRGAVLKLCNADKAALRKWRDELRQKTQEAKEAKRD